MADTTLRQAFSNIASAIRAKGVTGTMTPLQMPTKVASISSSKYGVSCDSVLGNVDQNGVLQAPSQQFQFVSSEIREIGGSGASASLYYKFYFNPALTSVNLPNLTTVGTMGMYFAFQSCTSLTTVNLPNLTTVNATMGMSNAFNGCTSLTTVYLSKLSNTSAGGGAEWGMAGTFKGCTALELVDFSQATAVPAISSDTFSNTNSTFQIVVPDALYSTWIAATNWSALSSQIVKASEYTPAS